MTENDTNENDGPEEQNAEENDFDDLFSRRPLDELSVNTLGDPDEWPVMRALARDVHQHGECHVTVEEHDDELEVRIGTTVFDFSNGLLSIKTEAGYDNLRVGMDRVVSWYLPHEPWH